MILTRWKEESMEPAFLLTSEEVTVLRTVIFEVDVPLQSILGLTDIEYETLYRLLARLYSSRRQEEDQP